MIVRYARALHFTDSTRQVAARAHLWFLAATLVLATGLAIASAPIGAHAFAPAPSPRVDTCSGSYAPC